MHSPSDQSQNRRRATDFQDAQNPACQSFAPSNSDILRAIQDLSDQLGSVASSVEGMKAAFVLNDLDRPDYDGHRVAHLKMIKAAETIEAYKMGMTKKILFWAAGITVAMFATGFVEHLKRVLA